MPQVTSASNLEDWWTRSIDRAIDEQTREPELSAAELNETHSIHIRSNLKAGQFTWHVYCGSPAGSSTGQCDPLPIGYTRPVLVYGWYP
jgi:hypothetical protein